MKCGESAINVAGHVVVVRLVIAERRVASTNQNTRGTARVGYGAVQYDNDWQNVLSL